MLRHNDGKKKSGKEQSFSQENIITKNTRQFIRKHPISKIGIKHIQGVALVETGMRAQLLRTDWNVLKNGTRVGHSINDDGTVP